MFVCCSHLLSYDSSLFIYSFLCLLLNLYLWCIINIFFLPFSNHFIHNFFPSSLISFILFVRSLLTFLSAYISDYSLPLRLASFCFSFLPWLPSFLGFLPCHLQIRPPLLFFFFLFICFLFLFLYFYLLLCQNPILNSDIVDFVVTTEDVTLSQVRAFADAVGAMPFSQNKPLFMPILL